MRIKNHTSDMQQYNEFEWFTSNHSFNLFNRSESDQEDKYTINTTQCTPPLTSLAPSASVSKRKRKREREKERRREGETER
jgi:hypothetical protein